MGSYAELYLGRLLVISSKNHLLTDLVGLFARDEFFIHAASDPELPAVLRGQWDSESDDEGDEAGESVYYYAAKLSEVADRLEYLGYSLKNASAAFHAWRDRSVSLKREMAESYGEDVSSQPKRNELISEANELANISLEEWTRILELLVRTGRPDALSSEERRILELISQDDFSEYFPSFDYLMQIRFVCDLIDADEIIVYDVTGLVYGEYFDGDPVSAIKEHEFDAAADIFRNSKTIVLVEGKSDIRILRAAMGSMFPKLADRFVFFDYEAFRIPGGAPNLVNLVKSFVAAGVANRVIALFDNDTGAAEALLELDKISLPRNVKVFTLPDEDFLQDYPTIGPNGSTHMNIQGLAAGIELYLGEDVLRREDGTLREVRWTGYSSKLNRYQGELGEKAKSQDLFLEKLSRLSSDQAKRDLNLRHMRKILLLLIRGFSDELATDIVRRVEIS